MAGVPISQRILSTGENLIILFPVARLDEKYRTAIAYVFKVAVSRPLVIDWKHTPAISANSGVDFNYLGDTGHGSGKDILRIKTNDWWVYHFGVGPENPNLRVYSRLDVSKYTDSALDYDATDSADPTAGSDYDFISSKDMANIFDPENEFIAFRTSFRGEGKLLKFGFYADGVNIPAGSPLYIRGAGYLLHPVTSSEKRVEIIDEAAKKPEEQTVKTIAVVVGGLPMYELGTILPNEWTKVRNYEVLHFKEYTQL